jgi:hypothetical protein
MDGAAAVCHRARMLTRRSFALAPAAWLALGRSTTAGAIQAPSPPPGRSAAFPAQDPEVVREVVVAGHGNVARLKVLVGRQPSLVKAMYDWGFGDWETALGGACHVGNREAAEYLIASGAQPTIFSAAMLGQLDVVKAFVAASPGVQRIRGPHSLSLLHHARAGGAAAKPVLDYLTALGDADSPPPQAPPTPDEVALITGTYAVDGGGSGPVAITAGANAQLSFAYAGRSRFLRHAGALVFAPAGADQVRIAFAPSPSEVVLTVHDPDVVLAARKAVKQ